MESDFSQRILQAVRQSSVTATAVRVGTARIGVPGIHPSAETLEGLVARHGNRVYQLAYRLTRSTADAEDVLQDVFFKLYRNWLHVSACENLDGWLTRVSVEAAGRLRPSHDSEERRPASDQCRLRDRRGARGGRYAAPAAEDLIHGTRAGGR
jgi:DNA-directed RNA polymerase specialized sigma24 family protein